MAFHRSGDMYPARTLALHNHHHGGDVIDDRSRRILDHFAARLNGRTNNVTSDDYVAVRRTDIDDLRAGVNEHSFGRLYNAARRILDDVDRGT